MIKVHRDELLTMRYKANLGVILGMSMFVSPVGKQEVVAMVTRKS